MGASILMLHFDVDTTAGWRAWMRYSINRPGAPVFAATPATHGEICSLCSCGDEHLPDEAGHPACEAPAVRIGRIHYGGIKGSLLSTCAQHLEALGVHE